MYPENTVASGYAPATVAGPGPTLTGPIREAGNALDKLCARLSEMAERLGAPHIPQAMSGQSEGPGGLISEAQRLAHLVNTAHGLVTRIENAI